MSPSMPAYASAAAGIASFRAVALPGAAADAAALPRTNSVSYAAYS